MTFEQVVELLEEVKPHFKPNVEVDKENEYVKKFIKAYKVLTGKTVGAGKCKNCVLDAYFELKLKTDKQLKFMTMERKYKLKDNRVVGFKNSHYTNANITDAIALDMVKANANHSRSFVNGSELLKDLEASNKPKKAVKEYGTDNTYPKAAKEVKLPSNEPKPKKRGRKPKAKK